MRRWTWQWLALTGLTGIIIGGYSWVRLELDSHSTEILEPDIEIYQEQYVDGHVLVKNWGGNERKQVKKNQMISWRVGGRHL